MREVEAKRLFSGREIEVRFTMTAIAKPDHYRFYAQIAAQKRLQKPTRNDEAVSVSLKAKTARSVLLVFRQDLTKRLNI